VLANKYNVVTGVEQVPFTPKDFSGSVDFRLPENCIEGVDCDSTVQWVLDDTMVHFRVRLSWFVWDCLR
jgi:hypothetical protein